jgi:hypothetical protein
MNTDDYVATNRSASEQASLNLYCDDLLVATIRLVAGDFPWLRGVYSLAMKGPETILSKTVHEYILTSQEEHRLAVDSDADPDGSILDGFLERNQDAMDKICNYHSWATIDYDGDRTAIMCPCFEPEDLIAWRLA